MTFEDYLTLALSLVGVLAVICITFVGMRWLSSRAGGATLGGAIRILDRQHVATNKSLMIVQVGEKFALIAMVDKQMNTLLTLERSDVQALIDRHEAKQEAAMKPIFAKMKKSDDSDFANRLRDAQNQKDDEEHI